MSDDITFCADTYNCPLKDKCRRAEEPQFKEYASYSDFYHLSISLNAECEYFMKGRVRND